MILAGSMIVVVQNSDVLTTLGVIGGVQTGTLDKDKLKELLKLPAPACLTLVGDQDFSPSSLLW
jgi:hypothetical protein